MALIHYKGEINLYHCDCGIANGGSLPFHTTIQAHRQGGGGSSEPPLSFKRFQYTMPSYTF